MLIVWDGSRKLSCNLCHVRVMHIWLFSEGQASGHVLLNFPSVFKRKQTKKRLTCSIPSVVKYHYVIYHQEPCLHMVYKSEEFIDMFDFLCATSDEEITLPFKQF